MIPKRKCYSWFFVLTFLASIGAPAGAAESLFLANAFSVFDHIVPTVYELDAGESGTFSANYSLTPGTNWTAGNLDPANVHLVTLRYEQDPWNSWELRIGRGGQYYSLRTAAGELIPPQEHPGAEWVDEVFQLVAVNTQTNNRDFMPTRNFIHQAGTYWAKPRVGALDPDYLDHAWYSPLLAQQYNEAEEAYYTLHWGQVSHVPAIFRSGLLIYTRTKNLGDGVIETTFVVQNHGEETKNWLNVPWGGVRYSSLPTQIMSLSTGGFQEENERFGDGTLRQLWQTNGWFAWTQNTTAESLGLGLVFGQAKYRRSWQHAYVWREPMFRWGSAGAGAPRDYNVGTTIMPANVDPGETFFFRTYFIVGTLNDIETKAKLLVDQVEYGKLRITPQDSPLLPIWKQQTEQGLCFSLQGVGEPAFYTFAQPVVNGFPLYHMRNTATGREFVSTDPYAVSSSIPFENPYDPGHPRFSEYQDRRQWRPYDGATEYLGFLGFVVLINEIDGSELSYVRLETILTDPDVYPAQNDVDQGVVVLRETR